MNERSVFCNQLVELNLNQSDLAVALLWYYNSNEIHLDRTASELANDLHKEGFTRPNVTYLNQRLVSHKKTIKGHRSNSFKIGRMYNRSLSEAYAGFCAKKISITSDTILPQEWFLETKRKYLINFCQQINGSYDQSFFDCSAMMCRRLMETLIIEVYVSAGRSSLIEVSKNKFKPLENLIDTLSTDKEIHLNRNTSNILNKIKKLGDTAAHNRTHITARIEINDLKDDFRRAIQELLVLSKLN